MPAQHGGTARHNGWEVRLEAIGCERLKVRWRIRYGSGLEDLDLLRRKRTGPNSHFIDKAAAREAGALSVIPGRFNRNPNAVLSWLERKGRSALMITTIM